VGKDIGVSLTADRHPGPTGGALGVFRHEALLYSGMDHFLARTVPFVLEGVGNGEPTLVMVDRPKIDLLHAALGDAAGEVEFADMAEVGRNPARIIPAWHEFVARHHDHPTPLRGIGEPISAQRGPDELVECQLHESLLNRAFADGPPWWLLCPYDTSSLGSDVLEEAGRSHPFTADGYAGRHQPGGDGFSADDPLSIRSLLPPPSTATPFRFHVRTLPTVRKLTAFHADRLRVSAARRDAFVLAVDEVATNSIRHGGGRGVLRVWNSADRLVCEIRDRGSIDDPLVGRIPPGSLQPDGRGLWMANQLCDLLQIRSSDAGTTVRLHLLLD
jgi:anti-sigma regulatory factor (Ser/Thr protein kinase)